MKRGILCILALVCLIACCMPSLALSPQNSKKYTAETVMPTDFTVNAKSAILMEGATGTVLFEQQATDALPPASVTKVMTLLLVMEAMEQGRIALTDTVTISANAASMGGSQVFLEEGERMSVEDLLKCTVIASANDAAVALAEHTAGSEEAFVAMMNRRAQQLGLTSTAFENVTGLDDTVTHHLTSSQDIAVMTRQLLQYPLIFEYSSLWQDTIRDGAFTLTNTNRLVRFYEGCNGLKTGSTDAAGFCVSVTATRDDMTLIVVIMGAPTRDERNAIAKQLLDYGFSTYALYQVPEQTIEHTSVHAGKEDSVALKSAPFQCVVPKGSLARVEEMFELPKHLDAPIKCGDVVGRRTFMLDGETIGYCDVSAGADVEKISFFDIFLRYMTSVFCTPEKNSKKS